MGPIGRFGHGIKGGYRRGRFELLGVMQRTWYDKEGMMHRVHGPASEGEDGNKHWMWHGESEPRIREQGPWSKAWAWRFPVEETKEEDRQALW